MASRPTPAMCARTIRSIPPLIAATAAVAIGAAACLPAGTRGSAFGSDGDVAGPTPPAATAMLPTGPTPTPSFVPPTPTPAPTFLVYTVVRGDSLNTIAHKFGTTARSIAFWNRATYPSLDPDSPSYRPGFVQVGWTLGLIPNVVVDEADLPDPSGAGDGGPVESEPATGP